MWALNTSRQGLLVWLVVFPIPAFNSYLLPESQLVIGVVGGLDRPEYVEYWNTTIARLFKVHFFNENGLPPCVVCNRSDFGDRTRYDGFHQPFWFNKNHGWWCAQSRPPQLLRLLYDKVASNLSSLPSFFLMADDDTWLNPFTLRELIRLLSPNERYYIGKRYTTFAAGGSGVLISKAALHSLFSTRRGDRSLVEACDRRKQGGRWCFWHSDWVVGACLKAANVTVLNHKLFAYDSCSVDDFFQKISCHHMDSIKMRVAFQALVHLSKIHAAVYNQTSELTSMVMNKF